MKTLLVAFLAAPAAAEPAVTLYNQGFAMVSDSLPLKLRKGESRVSFTETTAHLEPDSVVLRDPAGKASFRILEQSYRADPVSEGLLLQLNEGKTIDFEVLREDKIELVPGRIIRSGYQPHPEAYQRFGPAYAMRQQAMAYGTGSQPLIEVKGKLRFGLPGKPLFPSLPEDQILKPTLEWLIASGDAASFDAQIDYISGGFTWKADYNVLAPEKGEVVDLLGWVTMENQSGKSFSDARLQLMAGDVSKLQPQQMYEMAAGAKMARSDMGGPLATEKAFDEFHLYTLARKTDLRDRQTKQVEFVRAEGVKSKTLYVYDGAAIPDHMRHWPLESVRQDPSYGTQSNPKVWVMREFVNSKASGLGFPLPAGRIRFYRAEDKGRSHFTGESLLDHTPVDEEFRVYTGNAFDLVGERRQTVYKLDTDRDTLRESFEIKVRNRKKQEAEVRVVEHLYRWLSWEIQDASQPYGKTDARTAEFRLKLPPGGEGVVRYTAVYTW